jgi:Family of unknown function (DUF5682)
LTVDVLGIRHHGPGSARSLVADLGRLAPDCVLIEGPPDADDLIALAAHKEMRPPVALLVYDPEEPRDGSFYPFAVFSPEWQSLKYALGAGVPVRFIDLSIGHQLALRRKELERLVAEMEAAAEQPSAEQPGDEEQVVEAPESIDPQAAVRTDPLGELARAIGEPDGERFWDRLVESRRSADGVFDAIAEAMTAVRAELPDEDPEIAFREAAMRREIRKAEKGGFQRIAVVCGAWHVPALIDRPAPAEDDRLLRELPKPVKTAAAWVPWTYSRLSADSGYGAGITSPGWYEHLWSGREPLAVSWMARVARVFRSEDVDISAAHLIEAVRLADALAAMRGRSIPSLEELNEAVRSVAAFGSDVPLALVRERLIVGRAMGRVPADAPIAPLAADLALQQRRLRLRPEEGQKSIDLDLRSELDLGRSQLLHRLRILDIGWGKQAYVTGKSGTFHEVWTLAWKPEFVVDLIAASRHGTTIADAAATRAIEAATSTDRLATLTELIEAVLLSDLRAAVDPVVERIGAVAAVASDVPSLMAALPPLARVIRYGNVRGTDAASVRQVVDGLIARVCVGLGAACASLDDDAAAEIAQLLDGTDGAVSLVDDASYRASWHAALASLTEQASLHGLVAGRACRLLVDARAVPAEEATRWMSLALSGGSQPATAAAWVEGFLRQSGVILLHDDTLFGVLDDWVDGLAPGAFEAVLPLLRRTVSTFSAPERRALGERAKGTAERRTTHRAGLDPERADSVVPILAKILGVGKASR